MFLKTNLDTEKEILFAFIWLLPLIPLLAVFLLFLCYGTFLWESLLIVFFWFTLWGYIFQYVHTEICFYGDKISLKYRKKNYLLSVEDITYIEEDSFLMNPLKTHICKIHVSSNVNFPFTFFVVRNSKIQNNLKLLFPNVHVKQSVILD